MPITARTFLVAALAISGFPGFSGFFSKDMILEAAYMSGHTWLWLIGVVAAGMTAFYVFRAYFLAFEGDEPRRSGESAPPARVAEHHDDPADRAGGARRRSAAGSACRTACCGATRSATTSSRRWRCSRHVPHPTTGTLVFLIAVASGVGLAGIGLDYLMYGQPSDLADRIAARLSAVYRVLWNKYYVDELYDMLFIQPYVRLSRYFWQVVDTEYIDGAVNGVGDLVRVIGGRVRRLQTGNVQAYALAMLIGALFVVAILVV